MHLGLGYFFIDLLINYEVFKVTKSDTQAKILIPNEKNNR